jgi:hypothetical protein
MFFSRGINLLSLLLRSIKFLCLVMIQTLVPIMISIRTLVVFKPHVMRCLMKLMALKCSNMILMMWMMRRLLVMLGESWLLVM